MTMLMLLLLLWTEKRMNDIAKPWVAAGLVKVGGSYVFFFKKKAGGPALSVF